MKTLNTTDITPVTNFMEYLQRATRQELDSAIVNLSAASKNLSESPEDRRVAKNVLTIIRKERSQFFK